MPGIANSTFIRRLLKSITTIHDEVNCQFEKLGRHDRTPAFLEEKSMMTPDVVERTGIWLAGWENRVVCNAAQEEAMGAPLVVWTRRGQSRTCRKTVCRRSHFASSLGLWK